MNSSFHWCAHYKKNTNFSILLRFYQRQTFRFVHRNGTQLKEPTILIYRRHELISYHAAQLDAGGYLHVWGRTDHLTIRSGVRISPVEIEAAVARTKKSPRKCGGDTGGLYNN
jgi:hypothetical protein